MKKIVLFIVCFVITLVSANAKVTKEDKTRFDTDSINGIYIPVDEVDACVQLDKMLNDSTKVQIIELGDDFAAAAHFSMGMWIRNNWGLWKGSRLQTYLVEKGFHDPDDMSHYILTYYQNWLKKKDRNKDN